MAVSRHPVADEVAALIEAVGQQLGRQFRQQLGRQLGRLRRAGRAIASVRDPRATALRRRRRARRAVLARSGVAVVAGTATAVVGEVAALELSEVAGGSVTALAVLGAGTAGVRLTRMLRTPLPGPAAPPLPPRDSAAREPMQRLAAAEAGLTDLLAVLARPRPGGPLLPEESIRSTREAADRAVASLRATADAVLAVERAAACAPAPEREALSQAVEGLARQLQEGTDEVSALVAAAGRAVVAGGAEVPSAELTEATDRLAGLAAALRELAGR